MIGKILNLRFFKQMPGRASRVLRQNEALLTLAKRKWEQRPGFIDEIKLITEIAARALKVDRIGVWLYDEEGLSMGNLDLYERSRNRHTTDRPIRAIDYPQYFRALEESRVISADNAHTDPRTAEYLEEYLLPKGITSMLDAPIRLRGEVIGIFCIESVGRKRRWAIDEQNFASSLADYVAITFDNFERLKAQEELQIRVNFEQLVLSIANKFINVSVQDIDPVINAALQTIGEFIGVERCYTYIFDEEDMTMSNTNEWVGLGQDHKIHERQKLPLARFPWAIGLIKKGIPAFFSFADEIPAEGAEDKKNWLYFDVKSIIWMPLTENDTVFGFVGLTCTKSQKVWSTESKALLQIVAETLVNMFSKARALKEREVAQEERRILELRMEKVQKLESLGLMAGGIAHDFNNLLMGILGNAGLLLLEYKEGSKNFDRVSQIKKTAERAAQLTNQLLAYSGKGQLVPEIVDLNGLVDEIITLIRPALNPKARIDLKFSDQKLNIKADATQIRQVVLNLITNASDSLPDSGGEILVSTFVSFRGKDELRRLNLGLEICEGEYITLEVRDSGCGMSSATMAKIFDPFFTTKFTGRGLGLATVHGILRGHKGAITVDSILDRGTKFQILLPAEVEGERQIESRSEFAENVIPIKRAILVIDDEELPRSVVAEMILQVGYTVFSASSGEEGIEIMKLHGRSISAVLVDMTMPDLDGIQTAKSLRHFQPNVPIILMSGYTDCKDTSFISKEDVTTFLAKPFGVQELKESISKCVPDDATTVRLAG